MHMRIGSKLNINFQGLAPTGHSFDLIDLIFYICRFSGGVGEDVCYVLHLNFGKLKRQVDVPESQNLY